MDWDTAVVIDMSAMFQRVSIFNRDISSWDTAVVTAMSTIFHGASKSNVEVLD